jgi:hypothetical protein
MRRQHLPKNHCNNLNVNDVFFRQSTLSFSVQLASSGYHLFGILNFHIRGKHQENNIQSTELNAEYFLHSSGTFKLQHRWYQCLDYNGRLWRSEVRSVRSSVIENGICFVPVPLFWRNTKTIIIFSTTLVTCKQFY